MADLNATCVPVMIGSTNTYSALITISVQTMSGSLPAITISAQATVGELKQRVQALDADLEIGRQKMMISDTKNEDAAGVVLVNHRTLQSYAIADGMNVVLVVQPRPEVEVSIDDDLKSADRFTALLANAELRAVSFSVESINSHIGLLFQLFESNRFIHSVKISGRWTEAHLRFFESLVAFRPDIDTRVAMVTYLHERFSEVQTASVLRVLGLFQSNKCSFIALDFSKKGIDDAGCASLAPALQLMPSLQGLDLSRNQIRATGCALFASALRSMSSLQHLNLSSNKIEASGCASLAPALQSMSSLHHLDLSRNEIGETGCASLAPALQSMSSLKNLDLSSNRIGDAGCKKLAPALESMSCLQCFDLSRNQIGDAGCQKLAPALKSMSSLQSLDLSSNIIGDVGCKKLAPALQSMSSLQHLDLSENIFCAAGRALLAPATQSIPSLCI